MDCNKCFHFLVCDRVLKTKNPEKCKFRTDNETTVTIPTISDQDSEKVRTMASNGYAFVQVDFLQKLVSESAELAKLKIEGKMSETGSLFMKIDNPNNKVLSSLDIETGRLYEIYSIDEVISVDGCFVEGAIEHDT